MYVTFSKFWHSFLALMDYIKQRSIPETLLSICTLKNVLVYLLTAETYYCSYGYLSLKRLTAIWTLLEPLTQSSKEGVRMEDWRIASGPDSHFWEWKMHAVWVLWKSLTPWHTWHLSNPFSTWSTVSLLPLPCFLPLGPAERAERSASLVVSAIPRTCSLTFLGPTFCQSCSLWPFL